MRRRLVLPLAVLIAFVTGCKGMGGFASGLGKVAAGAARGVAHAAPAVAHGMARAAPVIARGAVKAAPVIARTGGVVAKGIVRSVPTVLRVGEAVAESADSLPDVEYEVPIDGSMPPPPMDPCQLCPLDTDCGACAGYAGYGCVAASAGATSRCESSAPPDAPPADASPATVAADGVVNFPR